jgi:mono/diheme cytochrome c family protein
MLPLKDKLGPADADRMVAFIRDIAGKPTGVALGSPTVPNALVPSTEGTVVEAPRPAVVPESTETTVRVPEPSKTGASSAIGSVSLPPPRTDASARLGAATTLFREYCLSCHGVDGKGNVIRAAMPPIPNFTSAAWQGSKSDPELNVSVLEGKGTLMPSFRGKVSNTQVRDLIAYVRSFGPRQTKRSATAPPASDFEARYRKLQEQWDELEKQIQARPLSR